MSEWDLFPKTTAEAAGAPAVPGAPAGIAPLVSPVAAAPEQSVGQQQPDSWERFPKAAQAGEMPINKAGGRVPWRVAVSLAETPEDQAATLRNLQQQANIPPDAEWVTFGGRSSGSREGAGPTLPLAIAQKVGLVDKPKGEKISKQRPGLPYQEQAQEGRTALIYTNPDTGARELFDPKGFSMEDMVGDISEAGLPIARVLAYGLAALTGYVASGGPANPSAPLIGHGSGVAASQAVNYGAEPLAELLMGIDIPESRGTGEQLLAGGVDVGLEASLPLAGGTTTRAGAQAARAPFRGLRWRPRGFEKPGAAKAIEQMAVEEGMDPRRAMRGAAPLVTSSPTIGNWFQALKKYPKAGEIVQRRVEDTLALMRRNFARIHKAAGGSTERIEAGTMIKGPPMGVATLSQERAGLTPRPLPGSGITGYVAHRNMKQAVLEDRVEKLIGADTMVDATTTLRWIEDKMQRAQRGGAGGATKDVVPEQLLRLQKAIAENGGKWSFGLLRDYRERIGPKMAKGMTVGPADVRTGELKGLYGALTEDLGQAAKLAASKKGKGGDALEAWKASQSHYAQTQALLEGVEKIANSETAEAAFRLAVAGAEDGPSKLIGLRATLSAEAWDALRSQKLYEMATTASTQGARGETARMFHPALFIRNWRKTSDRSKDVLFDRGSKIRAQLDNLAEATASEESAQQFINVSQSGVQGMYLEMVGDGLLSQVLGADISAAQTRLGLAQRLVGKATGMGGPQRAVRQARLMTDPDFVEWLWKGAKIRSKDPARTAEHLGKLSGLAASKPELAGDIEWYADRWDQALKQGVEPAGEEDGGQAEQPPQSASL